MGKNKFILVVIMIVILAAGWVTTIRNVTGAESIKQQNRLVSQADTYIGKELYVRAIPLYKEALSYTTGNNSKIEENLLNAYLKSGNTDEYIKLASKRITAKTASEDEYIAVADKDIAYGDSAQGISVLKEGAQRLESDRLKQYCNKKMSVYSVKTTPYEKIVPSGSNLIMAAWNGNKWNYIGEDGRIKFDGEYDKATSFGDAGYAVVNVGGNYYTINDEGAKYGIDENNVSDVFAVSGNHVLACKDGKYSYYNYDFECVASGHQYEQITSNACGVAAVKQDGKWGIITDSGKKVTDFIYEDVAVNSLGSAFAGNVAMFKQDGRWYMIGTDGKKISDNSFAGAKAPESGQYIAVASDDGKWGFVNSACERVIDFQYSDAKSFSEHFAAISKTSGQWSYINESNNVITNELYEEAEPFHAGIAQAKFAGTAALIKLNYYED